MCSNKIQLFALKLVFFLGQNTLYGQVKTPSFNDSLFSTYYHQRVSIFNAIPAAKNEIIFLGNSITDSGEWSSLFPNNSVLNFGISGDVTTGILHRLPHVLRRKPAKIFLMIGTNDLARGIAEDTVLSNILWIADYVFEKNPATQLFVQSILPVNDLYGKFAGHTKNNDKITHINKKLNLLQKKHHFTFIDLHSQFKDENGKLKAEYSNDGLHLMGESYHLWKHVIFHYLYDIQEKPAIIPKPRKISWNNRIFPLYRCQSIYINNPNLIREANHLKHWLSAQSIDALVIEGKLKTTDKVRIILEIQEERLTSDKKEGYQLEVNDSLAIIRANDRHGIFNGIQTLIQLARSGSTIEGCKIDDWPAFSWRGYMIDVGRNYMSVNLIKEQIDILARYKLNVLHFHATEDIAWRIQSDKYPQLTKQEHMLRNKGMYYTISEMKELIRYCKDRHITFVPEIDMPGHSAAFTRAMGFSMQSDSGLMAVKEILTEFCNTYDTPFIHIGSDEVKISNKSFIPEVTKLLENKGKKVIGWQPGGNFSENTYRQMWLEDQNLLSKNIKFKIIDSRHLYLNHMDPLEAVSTIFFRKISNLTKGDTLNIGATLCVWPDRAVAKEEDVIAMNAVYPGLLSFSERTWQGGGHHKWIATLGKLSKLQLNEFEIFEKNLAEHKILYFKSKPFPYTRQVNQKWKLFGPFSNLGNLSKTFPPETDTSYVTKTKPNLTTIGGTIILRHWWGPTIEAVLPDPKDSTTWYATSEVWSNEDTTAHFWIGFHNYGRAQGTDSPPVGKWDHKESKVWCNGLEINPPDWIRGGQKGDPEIPLIDEGYEYREPTKIQLKKGWNKILIKAPIGSLKSINWHQPMKWMFTCIRLDN